MCSILNRNSAGELRWRNSKILWSSHRIAKTRWFESNCRFWERNEPQLCCKTVTIINFIHHWFFNFYCFYLRSDQSLLKTFSSHNKLLLWCYTTCDIVFWTVKTLSQFKNIFICICGGDSRLVTLRKVSPFKFMTEGKKVGWYPLVRFW